MPLIFAVIGEHVPLHTVKVLLESNQSVAAILLLVRKNLAATLRAFRAEALTVTV